MMSPLSAGLDLTAAKALRGPLRNGQARPAPMANVRRPSAFAVSRTPASLCSMAHGKLSVHRYLHRSSRSENALICRQVRVLASFTVIGSRFSVGGMMTFTELAPAPSDPPEPFTDRLRLAVAAYLARFKGTSREHTES